MNDALSTLWHCQTLSPNSAVTVYTCVSPNGRLRLEITSSRCMGDTDTSMVVEDGRTQRRTHVAEPFLPGVGMHREGLCLYFRGDRDCRTFEPQTGVYGSLDHLPSDAVWLSELFAMPAYVVQPVVPPELQQYLKWLTPKPFAPARDDAPSVDSARRRLLVDQILAWPAPADQTLFVGLLLLFKGWEGPEASEALQRARTVVTTWPDTSTSVKGWLDWRAPHPAWQLVSKLTIREEGQNDGDEGLRRLAEATHLPPLCSLLLRNNNITDAGVALLAASPNLRSVETLRLCGNHIGDAGVAALARSEYTASLVELTLQRNAIGDEGASALAKAHQFGELRRLFLGGNPIGESGVVALTEATTFRTYVRGATRLAPERSCALVFELVKV